MNIQAFVGYIIDVLRTFGLNLIVFSSIALALDKATNASQFRVIIVFLIVGMCCVIFGAILSFVYKAKNED